MSKCTSPEKLEQFNEFFSIEHSFSINIMPLSASNELTFEHFINNMPMPFKMASDVITIDQSSLRSIQGLGNSAEQLVDFLNHQSKKIDLLVSYILSQQDEQQHRYQGVKFGGGGVVFTSDNPFELNQLLEMKVFILQENCAVYCYGEVIAIEAFESINGDKLYQQKVIFHFIQEDDREILVRASLHEQSKQLQALAKKRNQAN